MKILYRILLGLVILSSYFILSHFFISIGEQIPFKDILPKSVFFFTIVDTGFAYLFLKRNLLISLFTGFVVAYLSFFMALQITANGYYPDFDISGIQTAFFCNGVFSLLLWGILYGVNEWLKMKKKV